MTLLLLMASCSYTPEERAEKVVKDFCLAIQKNDYNKEDALMYDKVLEEVCDVDVEEDNNLLVSNLELNINRHCVITDKSKVAITSVKNIYGNSSTGAVEEIAVCDSAAYEVTYATPEEADAATREVIAWPSDINAAYQITVKSGSNKILFTVVQLGEKEFKIYSTQGLYIYDFSDIIKTTGCQPTLPSNLDDETMKQNVDRFIDDLQTFDIFSTAIATNDSAKIIRIFPRIANHVHKFNGTPAPKTYSQTGDYGVITTADSLAFKISAKGKIVDSYGVISTKKSEEAVKALGGTPRNRGEYFDIEYLSVLADQVSSLEREKERKAKAAKYKAQGVALISSQLSSDGNGAKGVEFSALNTSNKTAKYVIMEVVGYNSVDDPVWSNGYLKTCRGIGPIAPGEGGTWDFNDIWKNNGSIVSSYEIKKLTIQFTDGTSKSVKLPRALPSDWRNWLY